MHFKSLHKRRHSKQLNRNDITTIVRKKLLEDILGKSKLISKCVELLNLSDDELIKEESDFF